MSFPSPSEKFVSWDLLSQLFRPMSIRVFQFFHRSLIIHSFIHSVTHSFFKTDTCLWPVPEVQRGLFFLLCACFLQRPQHMGTDLLQLPSLPPPGIFSFNLLCNKKQ